MLEGFEEYTKELTPAEQEILPVFVEALSRHKGEDQAITNKKMREGMLKNKGIQVSDARVRKLIAFIRSHSLIRGLVSYGNKGYAVADNRIDIVRGIASLYSRARSIRDTALAMQEAEGIDGDEIAEYYKDFYFDGEDPAELEHP